MAQFGSGSQLAAQCPRVPTPDGWRPWTDSDGPIPDALSARAKSLTDDTSVSLGTTESFPLPGVTTLIRVEPRIWNRDSTGALVEGCFRASGVYLPAGAPAATNISPPVDSMSKAIGVLTVVSLAVGTVATLAAWGSK